MGLYDSVPFTAELLSNSETNPEELNNPFNVLQRDTLSQRQASAQVRHNKEHLFGPKKEIRIQPPMSQNRYEGTRLKPTNEIHPTLPIHMRANADEMKLKQ